MVADEAVLKKSKKKIVISHLMGPKREIFAQIRPIWIDDLGTRPKNPNKLGLGP